uniref:Uncharacterized protein n=1 Tax=Solanum tuberosum TaxID=4113 RepID=M1BTS8_SOLTU
MDLYGPALLRIYGELSASDWVFFSCQILVCMSCLTLDISCCRGEKSSGRRWIRKMSYNISIYHRMD